MNDKGHAVKHTTAHVLIAAGAQPNQYFPRYVEYEVSASCIKKSLLDLINFLFLAAMFQLLPATTPSEAFEHCSGILNSDFPTRLGNPRVEFYNVMPSLQRRRQGIESPSH